MREEGKRRGKVLILVSGGASMIKHFGKENLGGLVTPQSFNTGANYQRLNAEWAMDNDCFKTLKRGALTKMWLGNQPVKKTCLWATVPDVVANAGATLNRWREWSPIVRGFGYRLAFVAQDGIEETAIPWKDFDCLFLGGTTEFKVGPVAQRYTQEAKHRGKWVHMGRVNGPVRLRLALEWGCDSVDGTGFSQAGIRHLSWALPIVKEYSQKVEKGA